MKRRMIWTMVLGLLTWVGSYAQKDTHLQKMTDDLMRIRNTKTANDVLLKTIVDWSEEGRPKITLMDEIKRDIDNELVGKGTNKFRANQLVAFVYERQNMTLRSKGDYYNSTEKGVFYSAIEKTVKKGHTVNYTLTGHIGVQEFVFMAYNPKTKFCAMVNGMKAQPVTGKPGVLSLMLNRVSKGDKIKLSITNESDSKESFVIMNHNPQR